MSLPEKLLDTVSETYYVPEHYNTVLFQGISTVGNWTSKQSIHRYHEVEPD
jgi:hypothetical protein